jgi:hypothetical protein
MCFALLFCLSAVASRCGQTVAAVPAGIDVEMSPCGFTQLSTRLRSTPVSVPPQEVTMMKWGRWLLISGAAGNRA